MTNRELMRKKAKVDRLNSDLEREILDVLLRAMRLKSEMEVFIVQIQVEQIKAGAKDRKKAVKGSMDATAPALRNSTP